MTYVCIKECFVQWIPCINHINHSLCPKTKLVQAHPGSTWNIYLFEVGKRISKNQPFQVIPFRLVWLGLISWQKYTTSLKHNWNPLWLLWSNKNITTTIWTCPDPGWQNMFMKKESSWCWLVPNFKLPHFYGYKKHNQRRRKHRELVGSFFIGSTQKSTCCPEFNMQDFSSKNNLDCSLQYYDTACWTRNNWIQIKIQTSFQQRCVSRCHGVWW